MPELAEPLVGTADFTLISQGAEAVRAMPGVALAGLYFCITLSTPFYAESMGGSLSGQASDHEAALQQEVQAPCVGHQAHCGSAQSGKQLISQNRLPMVRE